MLTTTQAKDVLHPIARDFIEKGGGMDVFNLKEAEALNYLAIQLTSTGLWDKFKAIYPFVGRNAACHSINFKDVNRHNIKWYGSISHDNNGATGSGGYGNTLCALGLLSNNDMHLSVYSATDWNSADNNSNLMGASAPTVQKLTLKNSSSRYTYSCGDGYFEAGFLVNDPRHIEAYGLIMGVNSQLCYVNGKQYGVSGVNPVTYSPTNSTQQTAKDNAIIEPMDQYPVMLFTHDNFGSVATKSITNIRFATIGGGLTSSEVAAFYTIVESFQNMLGRAVGSIVLASTYYEAPKEYVSASASVLSAVVRKGLYFETQAESEKVMASANVINVVTRGARRATQNEEVAMGISIISFTEV